MRNIVVIGGGTGSHVVLSGLKRHRGIRRTAVQGSVDNGGSSKMFRDKCGVLPPGDMLKALTALSELGTEWRELLAYRFTSGTMEGHSVGNVIVAALQALHGKQKGVRIAHRLLQARGLVLPATFDVANLVAEYADGAQIFGESAIDTHDGSHGRIRRCYLTHRAKPNRKALDAIKAADLLVLGPGDIHTSVVPSLLVPGITDAIRESGAALAMPVNLACKRGQTDGFTAKDMVAEMERYLDGRKIDKILLNSRPIPRALRKTYTEAGEDPVKDDLPRKDGRVIRRPLIADAAAAPVKGDPVRRSLLRHDPDDLAAALIEILGGTA